jgi:proteasome lid subunit RPN8/RPN11
MNLVIPKPLLQNIHSLGEKAYPEEGAGLLLGSINDETRIVESILSLNNSREDSARHNRYLITAEDMMKGENEAVKMGLEILGVFHSHPDHPNMPSEFDLEWAVPWFSYIITSVYDGKARESRSWRLLDSRESFIEEKILFT